MKSSTFIKIVSFSIFEAAPLNLIQYTKKSEKKKKDMEHVDEGQQTMYVIM